ncbi:transposase [Xanthomonas citri pv. citri]|nr:transposase [Xanthomonas citri pv. citri]CEE43706.1 transposase [Xanthomonas citri pv. citri]CEH77878.1 transposase [Xanthomonas citri pv. citri]
MKRLDNSIHLEVELLPTELCIKKSKFTEERMVRVPEEVEAGAKVGETYRKHESASRPITPGI